MPWPGTEPGPPAPGAWRLSPWTTREVLAWVILTYLLHLRTEHTVLGKTSKSLRLGHMPYCRSCKSFLSLALSTVVILHVLESLLVWGQLHPLDWARPCSLLYPQHLAQHPAQSSYSVSISWMNERVKEWILIKLLKTNSPFMGSLASSKHSSIFAPGKKRMTFQTLTTLIQSHDSPTESGVTLWWFPLTLGDISPPPPHPSSSLLLPSPVTKAASSPPTSVILSLGCS